MVKLFVVTIFDLWSLWKSTEKYATKNTTTISFLNVQIPSPRASGTAVADSAVGHMI